MTGTSISFCMLNRNSGDTMRDCLDSVAGLVDEIIVVDTGSTDTSPQIAAGFGARIIEAPWRDDFAEARNVYLEAARCPWVLSLDSDEVLEPCHPGSLSNFLALVPAAAFRLRVRTYFRYRDFGWALGPSDSAPPTLPNVGSTDSHPIRLFRRLPGIEYTRPVHESVAPSIARLGLKARKVSLTVHHFGLLDAAAAVPKLKRYEALGRIKASRYSGGLMAHLELGKIYFAQGRLKRAVSELDRAARLDRSCAAAWYQLALVLLAAGRHDRCRKVVRHGLQASPGEPNLTYAAALADLATGRLRSARRRFRRVLKRCPWHLPSYVFLADVHLALKERHAATRLLERALELDPECDTARLLRDFAGASDSPAGTADSRPAQQEVGSH